MTDMQPDDSAPPKRPWYQFSLRTLLVLVLAGGMGLGWLGRRLLTPPPVRIVLQNLCAYQPDITFDADGSVVAMWNFRAGHGLGDDALRHIDELDRLQKLDLSGSQITDGGLQHLSDLDGLRELTLRGTRVTDAGVKSLQKALPKCTVVR